MSPAVVNPIKVREAPVALSRRTRAALRLLLAVCAVLAVPSVAASPASAAFGISVLDGGTFGAPPADTIDPLLSGPAFTQAGGHPYEAWTGFRVNEVTAPDGSIRPDGQLRNVRVDLPPGLIGNPTAVPQCPRSRKIPVEPIQVRDNDPREFCPASSVVGTAYVTTVESDVQTIPSVVFNIEPPPGVAASFGFSVLGSQVFLDAHVRADGDYGVTLRARNAVNALPINGVRVSLWGTPADPRHDAQRCIVLLPFAVEDLTAFGFSVACSYPFAPNPPGTPAGPNAFPDHLKRQPFLTLPTACSPEGVGLETRMEAEAWDSATPPASASFVSHLPPYYHPATNPDPSTFVPGPPQGTTGCEKLPFDPSFSARLDSQAPDSPTGLTVTMGFPQDGLERPDELATAHLRDARVTLPEGMTINPSSADGLVACSNAEAGFGAAVPAGCSDASKIATATAKTPLLEEELSGAVYVGSQLSDDPESGDMFRIFLALENAERGIFVKLNGSVRANRSTGRLVTSFQNNPQLPVSELSVQFKGGSRAPLATPPDCGPKTIDAQLTSWAGHVVQRSESFTVACPPDLGSFLPTFTAGTANPAGGAFSPFAVRISRADRQQYLAGLSMELPPGLLAKLKGVAQCPDAQADAGACGIESRVGAATVGAGPGSTPFFLKGSVFLTGPYKGAPFGLAVAVRAVAGPFDLGLVVVRQALFVDPVDAHVTVVSDPLPTIVKGVPVRLRSVNVDVDRPGFTLNPTSCAPKQIKATMTSTQGATHQVTQHFQVGDCQALRLRPRLSLRLTGRRQTSARRHPGVRAVLTQGAGQANLRRVAVELPRSLALDPDRAQSDDLCEFDAGQRVDCPASSIIGRARAITPVLNRPLEGPVYFVKNVRRHPKTGRLIRTLPTLLIPLKGEVDLHLRATTSVSRGRLVNTFPTIPDAPVSRFELTINGGRRGPLVVTRGSNLCDGKQIAGVEIDGHNGKRADRAISMKTPCPNRRAARLRVRRAWWSGNRLTVAGRVAKAARKRIEVTARCGKSRTSKRTKPRRGRWLASFTLGDRCMSVRMTTVTVIYPGGPKVERARAARRVVNPG